MAANKNAEENKENLEKNRQGTNKSTDGKKDKKSPGLFSYLLPILFATSIIFGIWAYFLKTNKFGLGEKYRGTLKEIPIVRMVLPPNPDPEAAEYMSTEQLAKKYEEYRKKVKEYQKKYEEQNKNVTDLNKYKEKEAAFRNQNETLRAFLEEEQKRIANERKQLQNEKLKFAVAVKNKDKSDFTEYYEKMDKETAAKLYEKVLKEKMASDEVKNYVKTFELMEPAGAAKILEGMGVGNMDLVANIMKLMKKQASAEIMTNMDPVFAANLADMMAVEYPIYPEIE